MMMRRPTAPEDSTTKQDAKEPGGPGYQGALLSWCPPIRIRSIHKWRGPPTATAAWHSRTYNIAQAAAQGRCLEYLGEDSAVRGRASSRLLSPSMRGGRGLGVATAVQEALETRYPGYQDGSKDPADATNRPSRAREGHHDQLQASSTAQEPDSRSTGVSITGNTGPDAPAVLPWLGARKIYSLVNCIYPSEVYMLRKSLKYGLPEKWLGQPGEIRSASGGDLRLSISSHAWSASACTSSAVTDPCNIGGGNSSTCTKLRGEAKDGSSVGSWFYINSPRSARGKQSHVYQCSYTVGRRDYSLEAAGDSLLLVLCKG